MKLFIGTKFILLALVLLLAACAPAAANTAVNPGGTSATPTTVPTAAIQASPTAVTTSVPTATIQPQPKRNPYSFAFTTYKDETNGFAVDYPEDWTLVPNTQIGSRGSTAQLFSPGTTAENLLDGGTRIGITVYLWDPKGDLTAYVAHRKTAWEGSGSTILSETSGSLIDGREQVSFIVEGPDKTQAFSMLTTIGDNYLEIAGDGDLALIQEIAQSMRPVDLQP